MIDPKKVRIRAAEFAAYRAEILALHDACFEAHVSAPAGRGHWWVAEYEGRVIGFAGMRASHQWEATGYLNRAGLAEDARGMRLQRRLIGVRVRKARALGWQWLVTETYDNPPSANNLIAAGFRSYKPARPWAARGAAYWRLDLNRKGRR